MKFEGEAAETLILAFSLPHRKAAASLPPEFFFSIFLFLGWLANNDNLFPISPLSPLGHFHFLCSQTPPSGFNFFFQPPAKISSPSPLKQPSSAPSITVLSRFFLALTVSLTPLSATPLFSIENQRDLPDSHKSSPLSRFSFHRSAAAPTGTVPFLGNIFFLGLLSSDDHHSSRPPPDLSPSPGQRTDPTTAAPTDSALTPVAHHPGKPATAVPPSQTTSKLFSNRSSSDSNPCSRSGPRSSRHQRR